MGKILYPLPPQNFEFVRNRIWEILTDEMDVQWQLSYDPEMDATIQIEAGNPYKDKVELPLISISLMKGNYGNKNQGSVDGEYLFSIDAFANAKTSDVQKGEQLAVFRVHKLLGWVRSILENPIYRTLGFKPPYISHTEFVDVNIMDTKKDDALNTSGGRLVFKVRVIEGTKFIIPTLIEGYDTIAKLGDSNQQYYYQGENYP